MMYLQYHAVSGVGNSGETKERVLEALEQEWNRRPQELIV